MMSVVRTSSWRRRPISSRTSSPTACARSSLIDLAEADEVERQQQPAGREAATRPAEHAIELALELALRRGSCVIGSMPSKPSPGQISSTTTASASGAHQPMAT